MERAPNSLGPVDHPSSDPNALGSVRIELPAGSYQVDADGHVQLPAGRYRIVADSSPRGPVVAGRAIVKALGTVFAEWDSPNRLTASTESMEALRAAVRDNVAAFGIDPETGAPC